LNAIIITGATGFIGSKIASGISGSDKSIICIDNDESELRKLTDNLNSNGGSSIYYPLREIDGEEIKYIVGRVREECGGIGALVNCWGYGRFNYATEISNLEWNKIISINLTAPFLFIKACLPYLLSSAGSIINLVSSLAIKPSPYAGAYCAAKAGLVALTKSLALEYGPRGVRVNAISVKGIEGKIFPEKGFPPGAPSSWLEGLKGPLEESNIEDISSVVKFLLSDEAKNVTGAVLNYDSGASL
jgi:NAD(P)-dependent dehydrogenase (short-subunit alcohol dehydrogenase family)